MAHRLIRDTTVYGLGALLSHALGFLLIPLYTRFLDVADYGRLALLNQILQVLAFVFLGGVSTAAMRFYYDQGADAAHRAQVYGTATALLLGLPPLLLLVIGPVLWLICERFLASVPFVPYVLIVLLTALFTPLEKLVKGLLRVQRRPQMYVAFDIAFFLTQAAAIVAAVAWLGYGLQGQLYAQLLANAAFSLVSLLILQRYCRLALGRSLAVRMLRFGVPLIPFFILTWLSTAAGRFLLEHFASLEQVGLFALAAQFAGLLLLASTAFDNAFMPHFLERAGQPGAESELGLLVTRYATLFGLMSLGIIIVSTPTIQIVARPVYHEAALYVAPLTLANWLFALRRPLVWSFTHNQRSGALSLVQGASVGVLIALLLLFLGPLDLGVPGVAVAAVLANLFFLGAGFSLSQSGFRLQIPWPRLGAITTLLLGAGAVIGYAGAGSSPSVAAIIAQLTVLAVVTPLSARLVGIKSIRRLFRPAA